MHLVKLCFILKGKNTTLTKMVVPSFFFFFFGGGVGGCLLIFFSKSTFFEKFFQEYHQCQTVWTQIKPDILLSQIWVQNVCKGHQQTTLVGKE